MLQSLHHHHGSLLNSLRYIHVSLVWKSPELDTVLRCGVTSAECRVTSFDLLEILLLMHLKTFLTFFATIAHCWLTMLYTKVPHCPLQICFSVVWLPVFISSWDFSSPSAGVCNSTSILNFMWLLSVHFSCLFRSYPSQWQHNSPAHQPFLPTWYCPQSFWAFTLSQHLAH